MGTIRRRQQVPRVLAQLRSQAMEVARHPSQALETTRHRLQMLEPSAQHLFLVMETRRPQARL